MKDRIKEIIEKHPKRFTTIIKNKYPEMVDFLNQKFPETDTKLNLISKIFWFLHDIKEFPKCKTCGKDIQENIRNFKVGYGDYCSCKCSAKNTLTLEKRKETNLEKYGCENVSQNKEIQNKRKEKFLEKFGCENPMQNKDIQEKIKQTNLEKYGCESPFGNKAVQEKSRKTNLERYGCENPLQNKNILEKTILANKKTNLERYGCENVSQNKEIHEKVKQTNLKNFGVEYIFKSKEIRDNIKKTNLEKFGVEFPTQNRNIRLKQQQKYFFNNKHFDSSPEIALYVYLLDHNIDFEYQPNVSFDYLDEKNKKHRYFPDFRIEDKYYEIKGDHFFNKNNELIFPFGKNKGKLDFYKQKCMNDNNVIILRSKDYRKYLNYIENKFGKDYLKQFKK